jgi:gas vesicle structural protein
MVLLQPQWRILDSRDILCIRTIYAQSKEVLFIVALRKSTDSSSLAAVLDRILDKGIVIDAWVRVSLVGIEILAIEARIVIASVETWLTYAEAVGLLADSSGNGLLLNTAKPATI